MSYLLTCGDSFTDPYFTTSSYTKEEMESMGHGSRIGYWKPWPEILAEHLHLPLENTGCSGASNAKIYYRLLTEAMNKTPEVIAVMWTELMRYGILGRNDSIANTWRIKLGVALLLSKCDINLEYETKFFIASCLRYIEFFYPFRLKETIKNYPYLEEIISDTKLMESTNQLIIATRQGFMALNNLSWENKNDHVKPTHAVKIDEIITEQLAPIYNAIVFCKLKNIKLIMSCSNSWDGIEWGSSMFGICIDEKCQNNILQDFLPDLHTIADYCEEVKNKLLDHPLFHEIEDLFDADNVVCDGWPFCERYGGFAIDAIPNFSVIGSKDTHPSPECQRIIGNYMYDLYKKNFA